VGSGLLRPHQFHTIATFSNFEPERRLFHDETFLVNSERTTSAKIAEAEANHF
jgi:hypothetical protein